MFVAITAALPILVFVMAETGLRLINYGPNLSLFITEEIAGRTFHIMNPDVKHRYFSRVEFSPNTSTDYFIIPKPEGTFRIICLGGSTTVGFPYGYAGSFSSFLRERLQAVFPERAIEVINLGMTATNSFAVNDIARELDVAQPDLLVVYDGHNEFYGALGVASHESRTPSRWLTLVYLRLIHLRTFLLARSIFLSVGQLWGSDTLPEAGTMMERVARGRYIPFGSQLYHDGLSTFKANLADLADIAEQLGSPALVATQASNLRHLPPFVSVDHPRWTIDDRLKFNEIVNRGISFFLDGRFNDALAEFVHAQSYDTSRADVQYHIARCFDSLGRPSEALPFFTRARDYDQLRFRTSSDFNTAIMSLHTRAGVIPVNVEEQLALASPDSIIGNELILEHLHPNTWGYFLIAKAYAQAMRSHGLLASPEEWSRRDTLNDSRLWRMRSLTPFDERCAERRIATLIAGWPFTPTQLKVAPINPTDTLGQIMEQLLGAHITWEQAHVAVAEYYEHRGHLDSAAAEYHCLMRQLPTNVSAYLRLGLIRIRQARYDEARAVFEQSLHAERTSLAYRILGSLALDGGRTTEALHNLEHALALAPDAGERSESGYLLALAQARSHQRPLALTTLRQVLSINPNHAPSRQLLNRLTSE